MGVVDRSEDDVWVVFRWWGVGRGRYSILRGLFEGRNCSGSFNNKTDHMI